MFTQEKAKYLLELPKRIMGNNCRIDLRAAKSRINLYSPDDDQWKFITEILSNKKITFRISLHHQEHNAKEGLLRIDFKSGHKNPDTVNSFVPAFLKLYAGKWLQNESHIHFFVESYRNLVWAMPLKDYDKFPIKDINSYPDFSKAIRCFAKEINFISELKIQGEE